MDGLGNMQVGGTDSGAPNTYVAFRFRAERSDALVAFRAYWLGAAYPGYGGGTGGTIRVSVESDNGGVPSGTVLASTDVVHPSVVFPLTTFSAPATLIAGQHFHLVFSNVDPNPTVNYASVNLTYVTGAILSPRQPNASNADYAALLKAGSGSWNLYGRHTPIIDLTYSSGARQGQGYMDTDPAVAVITGNSMARERFTVTGGNRVVAGASVRLAKQSGSGDVVVRLEDASGALIDSFSASTASLPVGPSSGTGIGAWVSGSFTTPRTLTNGATYSLRVSTEASTSLWTRGMQQGSSYGFASSTYFGDGYCQITTNAGSTWSTLPNKGTLADLQFYLS